jgi:hypothetical protein
MKPTPISPVTTSGTSHFIVNSSSTASDPIAQCAPCSRNRYSLSVPLRTRNTVRDRMYIAPIPNPMAMMIGSEVMANAPITPSKLNVASSTSRNRNTLNAARPTADSGRHFAVVAVDSRLRAVLVALVCFEQAAEAVDGHVDGQTQGAGHQHAAELAGRRQEAGGHDERDQGHDDRQLIELADAGEWAFQPRQPGDLAILEDEVEEQGEQEDPAERGDGRMRVVQQVGVGALGVHAAALGRQVVGVRRGDVRGQTHDDDREQQAHSEDRDEHPDGQEHLLPEGVQTLEVLGVDDGVVEGHRDLEDAQDGGDGQARASAVEEGQDEADDGDSERAGECL